MVSLKAERFCCLLIRAEYSQMCGPQRAGFLLFFFLHKNCDLFQIYDV